MISSKKVKKKRTHIRNNIDMNKINSISFIVNTIKPCETAYMLESSVN